MRVDKKGKCKYVALNTSVLICCWIYFKREFGFVDTHECLQWLNQCICAFVHHGCGSNLLRRRRNIRGIIRLVRVVIFFRHSRIFAYFTILSRRALLFFLVTAFSNSELKLECRALSGTIVDAVFLYRHRRLLLRKAVNTMCSRS